MPGYTDQSRKYLRLAVVNYQRAGDCDSPEAKAKFFELARQYADLALQLDDPAGWYAKHADAANPKKKPA
jgi:hypothetical protein